MVSGPGIQMVREIKIKIKRERENKIVWAITMSGARQIEAPEN